MVCMPLVGVRLAYLVHSQHTVFCNLPYILATTSQLQSLQRIHDDAVENILNLSLCRISLLRITLIVLCLVNYMSVKHIKCVTFQYENNWRWHLYNKQLPTEVLLHNKPASTGISSGIFCAQGHDKRYTLFDVNLLPPWAFAVCLELYHLMVLCPNCHS